VRRRESNRKRGFTVEYTLSDDLGTIVGLSALMGMIGGLAWEIAYKVRPGKSGPVAGLDNQLVWPRKLRVRNSTVIDLGFFGPMAIGAVAAVLLVLLVGRTGPDADDVAKALLQVSRETTSGTTGARSAEQVAEDALSTRIDLIAVILIGIASGVGGWPLIQRVTGRLTGIVESLLGETLKAGGRAAEQEVLRKAKEQGLPDNDKTQALAEAAGEAVRKIEPTITSPQR
jgi:hypothetical protein